MRPLPAAPPFLSRFLERWGVPSNSERERERAETLPFAALPLLRTPPQVGAVAFSAAARAAANPQSMQQI